MPANKNHQSAFIMGKKAALHLSLVPRETGLIHSQCMYLYVFTCDCPQSNLGIK